MENLTMAASNYFHDYNIEYAPNLPQEGAWIERFLCGSGAGAADGQFLPPPPPAPPTVVVPPRQPHHLQQQQNQRHTIAFEEELDQVFRHPDSLNSLISHEAGAYAVNCGGSSSSSSPPYGTSPDSDAQFPPTAAAAAAPHRNIIPHYIPRAHTIGHPNDKEETPKVSIETRTDTDILHDGYKWRKYGQKPVKNSRYPRSYYRCSMAGCPVKKRVERSSHDPSVVVTTYHDVHNHQIPLDDCTKLVLLDTNKN